MPGSYKNMRLFVMFDMPMENDKEKKEYVRFRKQLLKDGFLMLQFSVYTRYCNNDTDAEKHIKRVIGFKPCYGNVRLLKVTENQFENMVIVAGEREEQEKVENSDQLVVI